MLYASSVCYLCAHSRPLSPSSSNSLIVEGMEGSNAFRSTTPSPSPCSTPTLMPPLSPWRWNCTRRIAAPLRPRCCGFVVCFWVNKLKMLKEQGRSLICQGQMEWKMMWEKEEGDRWAENLISLSDSVLETCFFSVFNLFLCLIVKSFTSRDNQNKLQHLHTQTKTSI